ncbi:hypothetical protein LPJ81_000302 [Coemansia sp. IMI 209127]|nr:hypothetical protein LPJ81_000302 [Coemansia sp. IMI 209127]
MGKGKTLEPVALGYSEGGVVSADLDDPFLCKLGGKPVWLDTTSPIPCHSAIICKHCDSEMLLLVQTHVPLNDSPYDRVMYIWACNRRACSGRPGVARAIRAHILNTEYALKLVKRTKSKPKDPPPALSFGKGLFGNGASGNSKQLDFGSVWSNASSALSSTATDRKLFTGPLFGKSTQDVSDSGSRTSGQSNDVGAIEQGIKDVSISSARSADKTKPVRVEWPESTAHVQAKYLTFESEYLERSYKMDRYRPEIDQALEMALVMDNDAGAYGDLGQPPKGRKASQKCAKVDSHEKWVDEKYERATLPRGTDSAFSRFVKVVGYNSEQVVRYQYGGVPLIYSMQDSVARMLVTNGKPAYVSGDYGSDNDYSDDEDEDDDSMTTATPLLQNYSTDNLPRCPFCNGRRTFECQLMPALLTELPLSDNAALSLPRNRSNDNIPSQKRLVGSQLLQSLDLGVEFGTMMVFVCENDCHAGKTGLDYLGQDPQSMAEYSPAAYYEELVLVQQEVHVD